MQTITENYTHPTTGKKYLIEYSDADSFDQLPYDRCKQAYGVCFCGDKMVIGFGGIKNGWGLIGGSIEPGETFEQTLIREIKEESNMKILKYLPIGYQKVTDLDENKTFYQLRYACTAEPYGEFTGDTGEGMDGEKGIKEIKLIDPETYKEYFDWRAIGERIVRRAIELKSKLI